LLLQSVLVAAVLLGVVAGGAKAEMKKFTGSAKAIATLSETKLVPGDKPGHEVMLVRRLWSSKTEEFGESTVNQIIVTDYTLGTGTHRGYDAETLASGEKVFTAYEGRTTTVLKDGTPPSTTFEGRWWYTGGTGKFEGITGSGTYKGQASAAGLAYTFDGEYEIKK